MSKHSNRSGTCGSVSSGGTEVQQRGPQSRSGGLSLDWQQGGIQVQETAGVLTLITERHAASFISLNRARKPMPHYYRYMLTFIFAIDEINRNTNILPNVTLGYHVFDSCNDVSKAVDSILQMLSGSGDTVPNYSCRDHDKLAGVIGDQSSESSLQVFEILKIYGYTQISYGATDSLLTNKHIYPSFFQTLPSDQTQYLAIARLMKHFGWTWIGVITSHDDGGIQQEMKGNLLKVWRNSNWTFLRQRIVHKVPNKKNQCAPKPTDFLSYSNDPIALIALIFSVTYFVKTSIILIIFIVYRDTPVVKANNQSLSFLILVSIMLNFLNVLLFIDRPVNATCLLRHTSYAIICSVTMSSILAKTIMVYLAFKATKPGSCWGKFIQAKCIHCVVFIFSFVQVLISLIWLSIFPPFPEMNTHLCLDKIIIQCNEGSIVAFSILLGYMGLLAAVNFIVAFLARNLPDSFNEAKYITFSMLVLCSVWIAFIPAYMSVTGKNTVLVEIFAIISSNVGIFACIFFPKCYIILMRPDLNTKNVLLRHAH
ncbi:PREDICTED: vomeronasal type-2 receptor 26-like [Nanorana parkeri]|uniref:vomeronasal type-2 receptor 26-like n=1 Tax=Nanorana parkeri TaxID=125878 RepID=UPI00085427BF|nr:PREDICTED: vomeronasal type-2 receptor 26-like [Nanorana parkeri]